MELRPHPDEFCFRFTIFRILQSGWFFGRTSRFLLNILQTMPHGYSVALLYCFPSSPS